MDKLADLAAEAAVLSGIYHYDSTYYDVCDILTVDTFTDETNQVLYRCFQYLFEEKQCEKLDQTTVMTALANLGYEWVLQQDLNHLKGIFTRQIARENVKLWAVKIRKLHIARSLLVEVRGAAKSLEDVTGEENIESILSIVEGPIIAFSHSLTENVSNDAIQIGNQLKEYVDYTAQNKTDIIGISSGFKYYDAAIGGGFRRKTISLISARQKQGKSLIALNVAINASKNNIPVLYLDSEMDLLTFQCRATSNLSFDMPVRVEINEIENGRYSELATKTQSVMDSINILNVLPLYYISVVGKSVDEIISLMRKWIYKYVGVTKNQTNNCLLIYDYFKLNNSSELRHNIQEHQELGFMINSLHLFTSRYDIPLLIFSQRNREGERFSSNTTIRGSDRIVDTVDNVVFFREKSTEELALGRDKGNCVFEVNCARHGSGSNTKEIHINKFGKYAKIQEIGSE